jgi:hypothetical protein
METVIRLRPSELNLNFLKALQLLLADQDEVEITVRTEAPAFPPLETEEEFWTRLEAARRNVEAGENVVAFTAEEFEAFTKNVSGR